MVLGGSLALAALHVLWLARFRWGYLTDYDEAAYAAISLHLEHQIAGFLPGAAALGAVGDPLAAWTPTYVLAAGTAARGLAAVIALLLVGMLTYRLTTKLMQDRWAAGTSLVVGAAAAVAVSFPESGQQAPLALVSAVPLLAILGATVDVAQLTVLPYFILLVLASYGVGRRLMPPRWAALAALTVGAAPVVTDYSRIFHFGVPAAAVLTAAVFALLKSNGLRDTRWVVAAGALLALTLLARTMTLAYLPGVAVGVAVPLVADSAERRFRSLNFVLLWVVTGALAATWYLPNLSKVGGYLAGSGYGAESALYGEQHSIVSVAYWTKQLELVANYLYLPLLGVVAVCAVAGAWAALSGEAGRVAWGERLRRFATSPAFLPLAVVVGGYLVLSSTSNQGTAFSLPWLPTLIVLAVAGAASVRTRPLRLGLAALLVAVCAFNVVTKNGIAGLTKPTAADLPVLDRVTVLDGRDLVYASLDRYGYPVQAPPERLPAVHKRWDDFERGVIRLVWPATAGRGVSPRILVGTGDWILSSTRLQLASEEEHNRRIHVVPARQGGADTVLAYRQRILEEGANVILTSDPPAVPLFAVTRASLELAAQQLGFRRIGQPVAPDGRRAAVWWRPTSQPKASRTGGTSD